jgi:hypothetical protein
MLATCLNYLDFEARAQNVRRRSGLRSTPRGARQRPPPTLAGSSNRRRVFLPGEHALAEIEAVTLRLLLPFTRFLVRRVRAGRR